MSPTVYMSYAMYWLIMALRRIVATVVSVNTGSGSALASSPSLFLNQYWPIVDWVAGKKLRWNLSQNAQISLLETSRLWVVSTLCVSYQYGYIKSGPTLAQVMAFCLKAPRHYLHQCWTVIIDLSSLRFCGIHLALLLSNRISVIHGSRIK